MQRLGKPTRDNILRYCKYLLRKQEYEEVTWPDLLAAIPAIRNLKTKLYDIIDRNEPVQLNEFRKLPSLLFKSNASEPISLLMCGIVGGQKQPIELDSNEYKVKLMRIESPKTAAADADDSRISSLSAII